MFEVVSFGSAILDIMVKSADFKVLKSHQVKGGVAICEVYGGKTEVEKILMATGGGAANTSVSFRRKGLTAAPVAKIAADAAGDMIQRSLAREKVGSEHLVIDPTGPTGISVILVAPDGGRSILTQRGVAAKLASGDIAWEKLYQTKWFYISSLGGSWELLEDTILFAHKNGIHLAFNPGKAELGNPARLKKLLSRVDVLLLNRQELASLMGTEFEDGETLVKAASALGSKVVVMSEGKNGATAIRSHQLLKIDAFKVESADDTGAGDAFGSGLVYGLIKGYPLAQALKIGAANGASEVTQVGAQSGLLTETEVKMWLKKKLNLVERQLV